jgi:hypothetical protein
MSITQNTTLNYPNYVRHAPHLRHALIQVLGSHDFASIVEHGLRLQARYGSCFASARFLGFQVAQARYLREHEYVMTTDPEDVERIKKNGRMIVLRLMTRLRSDGLITTVRRIRPNATQGTNVIDFSALWRILQPILNALMNNKYWRQAHRIPKLITAAGHAILVVRKSVHEWIQFGLPPPLRNRHFDAEQYNAVGR